MPIRRFILYFVSEFFNTKYPKSLVFQTMFKQFQTQTQLRAVETKLASVTEARDSLQAHKCLADKTVEDLQSQLSDESTGRRLAEQSIGKLRLEFEDLRNEKVPL